MRRNCIILIAIILALFIFPVAGIASDTVDFEPAVAPSRGPENAPVTIIEIVDYM